MSMTKSDYEMVASVLRAFRGVVDNHTALCEGFAIMFSSDNKDFKRDRFLADCGVSDE